MLGLPYRGLSLTFVYCAQMAEDIDTISSAYNSPIYLPDHVKISFTSVNPFLNKFYSNVTHPLPVDLSVDLRHSLTNCGRMIRDSATVTMESL